MSAFSEIKITWDGKPYIIRPRARLEAIAVIEEILTLDVLMRADDRPPPLAKVAMAYGALLRHLGAPATNDEVYSSLFEGKGVAALQTVQTLLMMMVPPQFMLEGAASATSGNAPKAAMNSSAPSTKRPSGKNGSRRKNSGNSRQRNSGGFSTRTGSPQTTAA